MIRKALMTFHGCYFDSSNGAAVASRAMLKALAESGVECEVVCGSSLDMDVEVDLPLRLRERGLRVERAEFGIVSPTPECLAVDEHGVRVTLLRGSTRLHRPDHGETVAFLDVLAGRIAAFQPEVVLFYGGGWLVDGVVRLCRGRGIASVFFIHNFRFSDPSLFEDVDRVVTPSRFAADYYRETLGLDCHVLPCLIDRARVVADDRQPRYATFVNPSIEKGVYAFARIADELGRRRPDIPLLVVESRGTEATVAACGLDLRAHGNVFFMAHTSDPRAFWGVTRLCLLPSLWWENQPLTAVEAMINGIPVIGSDRGGIPETLGDAGVVLPLPDRLTSATRLLPTAEEIAPWVEAVIRLWDDERLYHERRARARAEAGRWDTGRAVAHYLEFLSGLETRPG